MEVKRNGRLTTHEVHLDITDAEPFSNKVTKGRVWPYKVVVTYQFLWSEGAWAVLGAVLYGFRNKDRRGEGVKITMYQETSWPSWLHGYVLEHTPKSLAKAEVVR